MRRSWVDNYRRQERVLFAPGRVPFAGDRILVCQAIEALTLLEEREMAAEAYSHVLSLLADGVVSLPIGITETYAGIAAAAGRQWDTAQEHFENAQQKAHEFPHKIAQPEVRRWYARMLIDRSAPGDTEKAQIQLDEAGGQYAAIGMPESVKAVGEIQASLGD